MFAIYHRRQIQGAVLKFFMRYKHPPFLTDGDRFKKRSHRNQFCSSESITNSGEGSQNMYVTIWEYLYVNWKKLNKKHGWWLLWSFSTACENATLSDFSSVLKVRLPVHEKLLTLVQPDLTACFTAAAAPECFFTTGEVLSVFFAWLFSVLIACCILGEGSGPDVFSQYNTGENNRTKRETERRTETCKRGKPQSMSFRKQRA